VKLFNKHFTGKVENEVQWVAFLGQKWKKKEYIYNILEEIRIYYDSVKNFNGIKQMLQRKTRTLKY